MLRELAPYFHVERVARFGAIQADQCDTVSGMFEQYDRGGHLKHPSVVRHCSSIRISELTLYSPSPSGRGSGGGRIISMNRINF
jgi:hypothetical protein